MFKKFKNLFSKKISTPISVKKNDLINSKEYEKFTDDLYGNLNINFSGYMRRMNDYISLKYPNYKNFMLAFTTEAMEKLSLHRDEVINVSQNTFLSVLTNYRQELEKCEVEPKKTELAEKFNENSKAIIQEAETIFEKNFKNEFKNLKETVAKNLESKRIAKIKDVKKRFKKWADGLIKIIANPKTDKEQIPNMFLAVKTLQNESKHFGDKNYKISKESRDLIKSIIYSGNKNNKRFKLIKNQQLSKSDKELFQINDEKSLRFVINMMSFVVDDANDESKRNFINEWVKKGCPTEPKKIYSN